MRAADNIWTKINLVVGFQEILYNEDHEEERWEKCRKFYPEDPIETTWEK
jgi:hypothetical protein